MRLPRFRIRTLTIAVTIGSLPTLRTFAADYPSQAPVPTVLYASLTKQVEEERFWRLLGVVCSVVYPVVAVIPLWRRRMTTRRWMLAVAVAAGVIWIESFLYRWGSDDGMWTGGVWPMLQLPFGLVLGFALFLHAMTWLQSPVPPDPPPE